MSSSGRLVVYPPSQNARTWVASCSIPSNSVSIDTPSHGVSSFDHFVTQWMSVWNDSLGRERNSSHVHDIGASTSPTMAKVHSSSGVYGVGPADKTGKSSTRYCPGGSRDGSASPLRFPRNPRETAPTDASLPMRRIDCTTARLTAQWCYAP